MPQVRPFVGEFIEVVIKRRWANQLDGRTTTAAALPHGPRSNEFAFAASFD